MSNTVNNTPDPSSPAPAPLTPEAVIAQLRSMRSQIDDVAPLSKEQRALVKQRLRMQTRPVVDASINVIGVLENVSQAIGQPLDEVRQLQDDSLRWDAVADEARAFLKGIEGANLIRNQRLALIATQVHDRHTARQRPGQGSAPAARRAGQTTESRFASQEVGKSPSGTGAGAGAAAAAGTRQRHVHRTVNVV